MNGRSARNKTGATPASRSVRYWHKAEHALVHCKCPLLTQSGHSDSFRYHGFSRYDAGSTSGGLMSWREIVRSHKARRVRHIASATTGQKFTVFIVDDDAGVLRALARLVRAAGYAVRTFSSALGYLENEEVDVPGCLVLDVRMPHLDGRQLQAALLRESDARPIIFISGTDDVPTAVAALKAGAIDFLSKPFTEQTATGDQYRRRAGSEIRPTARSTCCGKS